MIVCALAAPARAEGERAFSVGLSWATFSVPDKPEGNMEPVAINPDAGGTLGGTYEHAIGSDWSLRGEFALGLFYGGHDEEQRPMSYAGLVDVGAVFRFDVLKYVPYAFGGIGGVMSTGDVITTNGERSGSAFVLAIGGGLDILASRKRSWGFEGRLASFGGDITIFTLGVRGTHRWGYF